MSEQTFDISKFDLYINKVRDDKAKEMNKALVTEFMPTLASMSASISGKWHSGENVALHLYRTCVVAEQYITNMGLSQEDIDVLYSACMNHDVGKAVYITKIRDPNQHQKLYDSGWNRAVIPDYYHGVLSSFVIAEWALSNNVIDNEVIYRTASAVASHMGKWMPKCPQPSNEIEKMVAMCDYLASRKEHIKIE